MTSAPAKVHLALLTGAAGDKLGDYTLVHPTIAVGSIEYINVPFLVELVEEIIGTCEKEKEVDVAIGFKAFLDVIREVTP